MCNCTARTEALGNHSNHPDPPFPGSPEHSRTDPLKPARHPGRTRPDARFPAPPAAAPDPRGRMGTGAWAQKKIALDPAESSAIE